MRRESGGSVVVFLASVFVILGVLMFMIRLLPAYMDDFAVKRMFSSMESSGQLKDANLNDVRRLIDRRRQIDNLDGFESKDVNLRIEGNYLLVDLVYEVRTPLIGNIDAVVRFEHEYELLRDQ